MNTQLWHRVAVGGASCALFAILTGGWITTSGITAGSAFIAAQMMHRLFGTLAATAGLALGFQFKAAWWAVLLAALPGGLLEMKSAPLSVGILHGVASSALFSVLCVIALRTSRSFQEPVTPVVDDGSPSLRTLATITWGGLLIQTALGAMYRHKLTGLVPHVGGAMLVIGLVMFAGIAAWSMENGPREIKRLAMFMLLLTGVQMLLGIGAYLIRVSEGNQALMLSFVVAHVTVGAVTCACCALMGIQILRYVKPAQPANSGVVVTS